MSKKETDMITKVVKVPIIIDEDDQQIRDLKYAAFRKAMNESRFLANKAARLHIAYRLPGLIPPEIKSDGKERGNDMRAYNFLKDDRKFLNASSFNMAIRMAGKKVSADSRYAWAGKKSLPTFKTLFLGFQHRNAKLTLVPENENSKGIQFFLDPGLGQMWLTDEMAKQIEVEQKKARKKKGKEKAPYPVLRDDQRRIAFRSCFSHKDKGSIAVMNRILSGEYLFSDSQIKEVKRDSTEGKAEKKNKGPMLMAYISFKFRCVPEEKDPEKICGVFFGATHPVFCATNVALGSISIGDQIDYQAAKAKFRAERRRGMRRLGQYSKTKKWISTEKEKRWNTTYCHTVTRQIIKYCLQNGIGTIHFGVSKKLTPIITTIYMVKSMLKNKAMEEGICFDEYKVYGTKCSNCGHDEEANLVGFHQLVCQSCGKKLAHDSNVARNLVAAGIADLIVDDDGNERAAGQ